MNFTVDKQPNKIKCPYCYRLVGLTNEYIKTIKKYFLEEKDCTMPCSHCHRKILITPDGTKQIPGE